MPSWDRQSAQDWSVVWFMRVWIFPVFDDEVYHQPEDDDCYQSGQVSEEPKEVVKLNLHISDCHSGVALALSQQLLF